MWKWIMVALLVIVVAVTADAIYQEVARIAGETFNLSLGGLLFDLRPVVFTIWYLLIVIVVRWFITEDSISPPIAVIFIIFGLAFATVTTFHSLGHIFGENVYYAIVNIAESRWALTAQSGAFLIAIGVVRLLWPASKTEE